GLELGISDVLNELKRYIARRRRDLLTQNVFAQCLTASSRRGAPRGREQRREARLREDARARITTRVRIGNPALRLAGVARVHQRYSVQHCKRARQKGVWRREQIPIVAVPRD